MSFYIKSHLSDFESNRISQYFKILLQLYFKLGKGKRQNVSNQRSGQGSQDTKKALSNAKVKQTKKFSLSKSSLQCFTKTFQYYWSFDTSISDLKHVLKPLFFLLSNITDLKAKIKQTKALYTRLGTKKKS